MRLVAIDIDTPGQHAAMIDKLSLTFPMLSDPDRTLAIGPAGLSDPKDDRMIAKPALILLDGDGDERWRFVSKDFAERLPEEEVLAQARGLGLPPTTQDQPAAGEPAPGPRAMPYEGLRFYFRGARFAALAMGLRHGHLGESVKDDSKAYVAEMDRFTEALKWLEERRRG